MSTIIQMELNEYYLESNDWGEYSNHAMVKAFGLKTNRKAKCKSCKHFNSGHCSFMSNEAFINKEYRACTLYQSKNNEKVGQ